MLLVADVYFSYLNFFEIHAYFSDSILIEPDRMFACQKVVLTPQNKLSSRPKAVRKGLIYFKMICSGRDVVISLVTLIDSSF